MSFDDVITGSNLIFDKRSSIRSRDHVSFDVIDAVANLAHLLELDGLGTNTEKEPFTSRRNRGFYVAGAYGEAAADINVDRPLARGDDLT